MTRILDVITFGRYRRVRDRHAETIRAHDRLQRAIDDHLEADRRLRQRLAEEPDASPPPLVHRDEAPPEPPPLGWATAWAAIAAVSILGGLLVSAAAWGLVQQFGEASTGAAIVALEGAAATNAILAWFGGGAIAEGGGGMALGSIVFGLLGFLPAFAAWTWGARAYTDTLIANLDEQLTGYEADIRQAEQARDLCRRLDQEAQLRQYAAAARSRHTE